jgi:hypothetical protein
MRWIGIEPELILVTFIYYTEYHSSYSPMAFWTGNRCATTALPPRSIHLGLHIVTYQRRFGYLTGDGRQIRQIKRMSRKYTILLSNGPALDFDTVTEKVYPRNLMEERGVKSE